MGLTHILVEFMLCLERTRKLGYRYEGQIQKGPGIIDVITGLGELKMVGKTRDE